MSNLVVDLLSPEAPDGDLSNIRNLTTIAREFICEITIAKARVNRAYVSDNFRCVLKMRSKCDYHQRNELHPICCESYMDKKRAGKRKTLKAKKKAVKKAAKGLQRITKTGL
jgi:hypothetical protein